MRFLFVRLSSMGDVVLTTPLIRALHERYPTAEIHFLTRASYRSLLEYHPLLSKVHIWTERHTLRVYNWTGVVDLQKNLRSFSLRRQLQAQHFTTFPKENFKKWLMVRLKRRYYLRHVVERYGEALRLWGISPENLGPLEVHIPTDTAERVELTLVQLLGQKARIAVGLGGTYQTKRWYPGYYAALLNRLGYPVILLGGETEIQDAAEIVRHLSVPVLNVTGQFSLLETAAAIRASTVLITHDTGTAHLGAAVQTPTVVLWGNTLPAFGMEPWRVPHLNVEIQNLSCRPCSKLGYGKCPRGHHDCMRAITPDYVEKELRSFLHILGLL
ncbi:MAG: glycosyltransferase family 9 protein [Bacteroidia bacterium]|nr:glycosyltransferase family 9 protein [Bacteroidia bacterium]MDW8416842.1 glycosyltransferase family 9 protein [Bacteroidia bacterium]